MARKSSFLASPLIYGIGGGSSSKPSRHGYAEICGIAASARNLCRRLEARIKSYGPPSVRFDVRAIAASSSCEAMKQCVVFGAGDEACRNCAPGVCGVVAGSAGTARRW